jgi:hypothetical protein
MSLLRSLLHRHPAIRKPQRSFLLSFHRALSHRHGKATRSNLARHSGPSERAQSRWEKRPPDFPALALSALHHADLLSHPFALVLDASFLSKSGKKTWGVGSFWNGCHSRVERGLEISALALVDLQDETAYPLSCKQTPASFEDDESRTSFAISQIKEIKPILPKQVKYLLVDGAYTSEEFVNGVQELSLHVIGKLRSDANLHYLYKGEREKKRGRPKKYDGKVKYSDLSRWEVMRENDKIIGRTKCVWSMALKREIRVVLVRDEKNKHTLFYSTNTEEKGEEILRMYRLRFQIEFAFRDAKQYLGLGEGQMRGKEGQHFHSNMSLLSLTVMKAEERLKGAEGRPVGQVKQCLYNEELILRIFSLLDLCADSPQNQTVLQKARFYGALAA